MSISLPDCSLSWHTELIPNRLYLLNENDSAKEVGPIQPAILNDVKNAIQEQEHFPVDNLIVYPEFSKDKPTGSFQGILPLPPRPGFKTDRLGEAAPVQYRYYLNFVLRPASNDDTEWEQSLITQEMGFHISLFHLEKEFEAFLKNFVYGNWDELDIQHRNAGGRSIAINERTRQPDFGCWIKGPLIDLGLLPDIPQSVLHQIRIGVYAMIANPGKVRWGNWAYDMSEDVERFLERGEASGNVVRLPIMRVIKPQIQEVGTQKMAS